MIGAEAIINANVATPSVSSSYIYENRTRCADKECKKLVNFKIRCLKKVFWLSSELRIVDVSKGDIIFADTLQDSRSYKHCADDSVVIPSTKMAGQYLAGRIAYAFTKKLTPQYRYFDVTLLEEPDLAYTDKQEELLKYSLTYIKQSHFDKAKQLLKRLVDATASQSYVPFYNLGVVSEAQGEFASAKKYYTYADNLMVQPVEEISQAVLRIEKLIAKQN